MTISKIATYGLLTISGVAIGVTGVSSLQSHAENTATNSSSNTSMVAAQDRPNLEARKTHREAIKKALTNKDYEAWKKAHSESNFLRSSEMLKLIDTQEKFDKLVEGFNARKNGDTEKAKQIATELGLPKPMHKGGMGMMKR